MKKDPSWASVVSLLVLLACYAALIIFIRGKIPNNPAEFLQMIQGLYASYGNPLIFFGALLEATFPIGFYLPGSTVVLFGAALSKAGVTSFPVVIAIGVVGFLLGFCINYCLGRYGWYTVLSQFGLEGGIDIAKEKLHKNATKAMFLGYFFPGSASFMSTAAGVVKMPFEKFLLLSVVSEVFWALCWGGVAYVFGLSLVEFVLKYFTFVIIAAVIVYLLKRYFTKKK